MILDLTFQPFGLWRVLGKGKQTAHGQFWVAQCACGSPPVELAEETLVGGWAKSCGCDHRDGLGRPHVMQDWTGQQLKHFLILECLGNIGGAVRYRTRCLCKKEATRKACNLVRKNNASCVSCAKRPKITRRWRGSVFIKEEVGRNTNGDVLVCIYCEKCKQESVKPYSRILRTSNTSCGCTVKIPQNLTKLLVLLGEGKPLPAIARELGVHRKTVWCYLNSHPEIRALVASLGDTDILIDDTSVHRTGNVERYPPAPAPQKNPPMLEQVWKRLLPAYGPKPGLNLFRRTVRAAGVRRSNAHLKAAWDALCATVPPLDALAPTPAAGTAVCLDPALRTYVALWGPEPQPKGTPAHYLMVQSAGYPEHICEQRHPGKA